MTRKQRSAQIERQRRQAKGMDLRIFVLWRLLNSICDRRDREDAFSGGAADEVRPSRGI